MAWLEKRRMESAKKEESVKGEREREKINQEE